jgi:60 kDa SS-A/Ro ribonucleoprotein
MATPYTRDYSRKGPTQQTKAIPGREKEQFASASGGYLFKTDDWVQLERFLKFGTIGGTYYVSEQALTREMGELVDRCLKEDGIKTVDMIIDISTKGHAIRQDQVIFALALACSIKHGDHRLDTAFPNDPLRLTREYALKNAHRVLRTGSHLLMFVNFSKSQRGWGWGMKNFIKRWYAELSPAEKVAYQVMKYKNRNDWTHRDVLRLGHVQKVGEEAKILLDYVRKGDAETSAAAASQFRLIEGVQKIFVLDRSDTKSAVKIIQDYNLPRECVPTEFMNEVAVWEAMLQDMPMMAMIRNLSKMTSIGLIGPNSEAEKLVVARLNDTERLAKARIHPIKALIALKTYSSGKGFRGKLSWSPRPKVIDALDEAFYKSFGFVEPTGKTILVAVDNSGSMSSPCAGEQVLSAREAAVAMAMLYVRTEENVVAMKFATSAEEFKLSKKTRLDDAIKQVGGVGEGTDCSVPIKWAEKNKIDAEAIIEITDSQSWYGGEHVSEAFKRYANKSGHMVKFVVDQASSDKGSLCDPKDSRMMDVAGFDGSVPLAIASFLTEGKQVEQSTDMED